MGSFNSFATKKATGFAGLPVWLGTIRPMPVGGVLATAYAAEGAYIPAGSPIELKSGKISPFVCWEVVSVDTSTHAITVKADALGYEAAVDEYLAIFAGSDFAATSAAEKISSIAKDSDGNYVFTMASNKLDGATAGQYLAYADAEAAAASGKSLKVQPNAYLYNDICIDKANIREEVTYVAASGAAVNFHGEGLLINRTIGYPYKAALKKAVPQVMQFEY